MSLLPPASSAAIDLLDCAPASVFLSDLSITTHTPPLPPTHTRPSARPRHPTSAGRPVYDGHCCHALTHTTALMGGAGHSLGLDIHTPITHQRPTAPPALPCPHNRPRPHTHAYRKSRRFFCSPPSIHLPRPTHSSVCPTCLPACLSPPLRGEVKPRLPLPLSAYRPPVLHTQHACTPLLVSRHCLPTTTLWFGAAAS